MSFIISGKEEMIALTCNDVPVDAQVGMEKPEDRRNRKLHDLISPDEIFDGPPLHDDSAEVVLTLTNKDAEFLVERIEELCLIPRIQSKARRHLRAIRARLCLAFDIVGEE